MGLDKLWEMDLNTYQTNKLSFVSTFLISMEPDADQSLSFQP